MTTEWNARPKHRFLPEFRCRLHPASPQRPFLPYLFPRMGKDMAAGGRRQLQICCQISIKIKRPVQPDKAAPEFFYCGSCGGVGSCAAFFALRFLRAFLMQTITAAMMTASRISAGRAEARPRITFWMPRVKPFQPSESESASFWPNVRRTGTVGV